MIGKARVAGAGLCRSPWKGVCAAIGALALALAGQICQASPVAVSLAKQVVNSLAGGQPVTALESIASGLAAQSADGREGNQSFKQKRKPSFSGF